MKRRLTWVFGITVMCWFWTCDVTYAQVGASQLHASNFQNTTSHTNNTQGSSQTQAQRCVEGKRQDSQSLPKPERNRFAEGKGKHVRCRRTRKKSRSSTPRKNTRKERLADAAMSEGDTPHSPKQTGRKQPCKVRSERIDDIPLLLGVMVQIGYQKIIDKHIRSHGNQRDVSWGWTAVIWLAYILSEGDHRKVAVRDYVRGMKQTLTDITGQNIDELDCTDDRLGILLRHFSQRDWWMSIEHDMSVNSIEVYELPKATVRCDATTASGYHDVAEEGLFQFGNSKDDPHRPQIKIMTGSLDPLGMPLATDVVSGEQADDGLYRPVITRINAVLQRPGVLYVGDCT